MSSYYIGKTLKIAFGLLFIFLGLVQLPVNVGIAFTYLYFGPMLLLWSSKWRFCRLLAAGLLAYLVFKAIIYFAVGN